MFNYKRYLPLYVANGNPSADTIRHYEDEIDNYINWLEGNAYDWKEVTELDARQYIRYMIMHNYSDASISLKLTAAKTFYNVAVATGNADNNPFTELKAKAPVYDDADFFFLTTEEIREICLPMINSPSRITARNLAMFMLMAVEGLRTVEVHRMNDTDYNKRTKSLLIHGKGHDGYIYPCEDTILVLRHYATLRGRNWRDEYGIPTFVSYSSNVEGRRISRNGIRWIINRILIAAGKKEDGEACHMLRHSCGTNLYAETKDLRLVQETLRQKSPDVAARYAHVQERIQNRATGRISPFGGTVHGEAQT